MEECEYKNNSIDGDGDGDGDIYGDGVTRAHGVCVRERLRWELCEYIRLIFNAFM